MTITIFSIQLRVQVPCWETSLVHMSETINEWPSSTSSPRHLTWHHWDWFCNNYLDNKMSNFWSEAHDPESNTF